MKKVAIRLTELSSSEKKAIVGGGTRSGGGRDERTLSVGTHQGRDEKTMGKQ